jgi:hypothetical protein
MSEAFSMHRLGLLLRVDLVARYRSVLIVSGTIAALILVQGMLSARSINTGTNIFSPWFVGMLFVWGPIAASYSFGELHDKTRNEAYLLLPASALEKTISRLLLATIAFVVYVTIFMIVVSWLNAGLTIALFDRPADGFSLGALPLGQILAHVLVVQSVYFLGAAWFRRAHFIKTAFSIALLIVALVALAVVAFGFPDILWGSFPGLLVGPGSGFGFNPALMDFVSDAARVLYFVVLPPFCWWVAWLRVRETQVSHGV